ncbi:MAG: LysM peptidoglycan-binding domain-containing protein [Polyangiaceae bacterium]
MRTATNWTKPLAIVVGISATAYVQIAFAQATVPAADQGAPIPGASGGSSGATGGAAAGGAQGGTSTTTTTITPVYPYGVQPPLPGQPLGGGNATESSSRGIQGNETDHFDLGQSAGSSGTAYGDDNGPVFLNGSKSGSLRIGGAVPNTYIVKKGDTLWDICDGYFQNPYEWPRIWSYNPQLQNPHWIYPGDEIALKGNGIRLNSTSDGSHGPAENDGLSSLVDRRRQVPNNTIFLRDQGFIDDTADQNWGEIIGSPVDKMFLSDFDSIYLKMAGNRDVKLGQELTIFRPVKTVPGGKVVQIQGTVRVDSWNANARIARGQIIESLDVIERGARIGPIMRKFSVVPPARNDGDVAAHVLASIHQHEFYGQNQVVFIDKGAKEGVRLGNRLFIIRKGDAWRQSLSSETDATRIALESNSPAEIESVPTPHNTSVLPEEVIGELRVVDVRDHTATCVVTQSRKEIETGDDAIGRKGY